MKRFLRSATGRAVSLVLTACSLCLCVISASVLLCLLMKGYYIHPKSYLLHDAESQVTDFYSEQAVKHASFETNDAVEYFGETNYSFRILGENGEVLDSFGNVMGEADYVRKYFDVYYSAEEGKWTNCTVESFLPESFDAKDLYSDAFGIVERFYVGRFYGPVVFAVSVLLLIVSLCFLAVSAPGKQDGPALSAVHKIPLDVLAGVVVIFICFQIILICDVIDGMIFWRMQRTAFFIAAAIGSVSVSWLFYSMCARLKYKALVETTLIGQICRLILHILKKICRAVRLFFASLGLIWKTVVIFLAVSTVEYLFLSSSWGEPDVLLPGWFIERLVLFAVSVYVVISLRRLYVGGKLLADGSVDKPMPLDGMILEFREHGEHLNNVRDGIRKAVDERMRSERFKTELITNVSHDIKTPLTSIINYVDILAKTDPSDPACREYLDILSRQSARLKKLIEDLIEASKASTGAIRMDMTPCDAPLLLQQALGEYRDRLHEAGLDIVEDITDVLAPVLGDGRYLWRVFDNLLGNIRKYSMPGTRVYVTATVIGGRLIISFRNISKEPLMISADELQERFVRGDMSRNTEGSGLGLSIAKSLCERMNAELSVTVDGDLFKAVVDFPVFDGE